ncbi:hypothetical protein CQW49_06955 [Methylosinus trichosporium OB3b]|uniref:Uncharacterized protein n=1 Tax=Methylosinus trichosporium (strain ATCC 35070 / NCIMB 11131 / UNIQEM 75 / OB3b) TaxID=595536 RepID=A0A2D2D5L8_METT3|nr:hypothetical protein CQW49_06955 [Methylosinus trichosporium OB3b]
MPPYDPAAIGAAIDNITSALERLRLLLVPEESADTSEFDPKDPANKYEVGGIEKLTKRGIEICYRYFDAGKTRYAVSELMNISFGAANHRYKAWEKAGGVNRVRTAIE